MEGWVAIIFWTSTSTFDRLDFFSIALLRLTIDCEAISGPSLQQGASVKVGQPQEFQRDEGTAATVTQSLAQKSDTVAFLSGNVRNEAIHSSQEILNLIAIKYLSNLNPKTLEDFNNFTLYMEKVRKVILVDWEPGSLIITVECGSLEILEELWQDYCTGNLGQVVQKCLVTKDILKELGLTEVKLTTTIDEKDYRACQKYLTRGRYDVHDTTHSTPTLWYKRVLKHFRSNNIRIQIFRMTRRNRNKQV